MRKIELFMILFILGSYGCTNHTRNVQEDMTDSIVNQIDAGKINELNAEQRAYWGMVVDKANRGEILSSDESRLLERIDELSKKENPGRFLPDRCVLRPSFDCVDFSVSKNQIQLTISQSYGYDLKNVKVSVSSCNKSSILDIFTDGTTHLFVLGECNNQASEETGKLKDPILVEYTDKSDSTMSSIGELYSQVKG